VSIKLQKSFSALSVRMPMKVLSLIEDIRRIRRDQRYKFEGFDPGSERTLAAWLRHASRTDYLIEQSKG
jgi:hypothetical protein